MKILIAVDDSPHSQAAVEFVRRATWPAGSEVLVLSAVRPPVNVYSEIYAPSIPDTEAVEEAETRTHQDLVSATQRDLAGTGLVARGQVVRGDPREAIVQAARTERVDLVVVGSHGRTGLARLLLGSVADHVVSHAHCSVLVVKLPGRTA